MILPMEKKEVFNVAVFQQDIVWENPKANFDKVEKALSSALEERSADLLVMPETFTTGFGDHMAQQAESMYGPTFDFAVSMAKRYDAMFAASWTVKEDGKVYNRLHCVRPDGSCVYYDKGHTFRMSTEAAQLARGTSRPLVEWRGWVIRPAVCYDLRFPLWLRNSADLEYDILLLCANWPGSRHEAWTTLLKARAIENLSYTVGCNRAGIDGTGIPYAGCSAVVDFKGLPLTEPAVDTERVLYVSLSAEALKTFRNHWPFNVDFDTPASLWKQE